MFRKIEPYLTFLNILQLERQGADMKTRVEELETVDQSLRNRDKLKDDAIAQLSDRLMALTAIGMAIIASKGLLFMPR
jgi:hypothetical protein